MTGDLLKVYECGVVSNMKRKRSPFSAEITFHDSLGGTESLSEICPTASSICQDGVK